MEEAEIWRLATQDELALREPPEFQGPSTSEVDFNLIALLPPQGHGENSQDPEEEEAPGVGLEAAGQLCFLKK